MIFMCGIFIKDNKNNPLQDERYFVRLGWGTLLIGFFGFLIWATFAPLDKGVTSSGSVIVSGHRKTIQASSNGIIKKIFVKDGDIVKAGTILVQLNQEEIKTNIDSLQNQYYTNLAVKARLQAEQDDVEDITFPTSIDRIKDTPYIMEIISLQKQLIVSRRQGLQSEIDSYKQSIAGIKSKLKGLRSAYHDKMIRVSTLREQMNSLKRLAIDGYTPRNRYLDAQRQFAEANSDINETNGQIGQLEKQLQEYQQRIKQCITGYQREVREQLIQTEINIDKIYNNLRIAKLELKNTIITSPVDGTVVGLNIFTESGIVNSGEHLMDIVPSNTPLIVDSRLKVNLIDKVHAGLPVDIMFTAFNQNRTPKVPGIVTLVSADRLIDNKSGESYYHLQITVTPENLKAYNINDIKPGMPAEIFIKTGSRSLLSYLFKPILDRAYTSLSED